MPAQLGAADEILLAEMNRRRLVVVANRREMIRTGIPASAVEPVDGDARVVIVVPRADAQNPFQIPVLERRNDPPDKRLQIRRASRRKRHVALRDRERAVEFGNLHRFSVALHDVATP